MVMIPNFGRLPGNALLALADDLATWARRPL